MRSQVSFIVMDWTSLIRFIFILGFGISSGSAKNQQHMVSYYLGLAQHDQTTWKELDQLGETQLCKNIAMEIDKDLQEDLTYNGVRRTFKMEYLDESTQETKNINNIPVLKCKLSLNREIYAGPETPYGRFRPTQYIKADSENCIWEVEYTDESSDSNILTFIEEICSPIIFAQ